MFVVGVALRVAVAVGTDTVTATAIVIVTNIILTTVCGGVIRVGVVALVVDDEAKDVDVDVRAHWLRGVEGGDVGGEQGVQPGGRGEAAVQREPGAAVGAGRVRDAQRGALKVGAEEGGDGGGRTQQLRHSVRGGGAGRRAERGVRDREAEQGEQEGEWERL